jgi:hypothetical protein
LSARDGFLEVPTKKNPSIGALFQAVLAENARQIKSFAPATVAALVNQT